MARKVTYRKRKSPAHAGKPSSLSAAEKVARRVLSSPLPTKIALAVRPR